MITSKPTCLNVICKLADGSMRRALPASGKRRSQGKYCNHKSCIAVIQPLRVLTKRRRHFSYRLSTLSFFFVVSQWGRWVSTFWAAASHYHREKSKFSSIPTTSTVVTAAAAAAENILLQSDIFQRHFFKKFLFIYLFFFFLQLLGYEMNLDW